MIHKAANYISNRIYYWRVIRKIPRQVKRGDILGMYIHHLKATESFVTFSEKYIKLKLGEDAWKEFRGDYEFSRRQMPCVRIKGD